MIKPLKNYGQKSKRMVRIALFIKGIAGTLSVSAYVQGNEHYAFIALAVGAICNEIVNLIKDEQDISSNDNS